MFGLLLGATWSSGDYAGADVILADGDALDGALRNVGAFVVPAGVTATAASRKVVVRARQIRVEGTLDGAGRGFAGGDLGLDGAGDGGGHAPGGGGGGAGAGGAGVDGGAGGVRSDPFQVRAGAGGADGGAGSAGGAAWDLRATELILLDAWGRIVASGATPPWPAECGSQAGGGGAGGLVRLDAPILELRGFVDAVGGDGGDGANCSAGSAFGPGVPGGGGGGGGVLAHGNLRSSPTLDLAGGAGGEGPGAWGAVVVAADGAPGLWRHTLRDADLDGVDDRVDPCPAVASGRGDFDADGVGDQCDPCPFDAPDDGDGDGVCDSDDACPGSDDALDADGDGVADCFSAPAAVPVAAACATGAGTAPGVGLLLAVGALARRRSVRHR